MFFAQIIICYILGYAGVIAIILGIGAAIRGGIINPSILDIFLISFIFLILFIFLGKIFIKEMHVYKLAILNCKTPGNLKDVYVCSSWYYKTKIVINYNTIKFVNTFISFLTIFLLLVVINTFFLLDLVVLLKFPELNTFLPCLFSGLFCS